MKITIDNTAGFCFGVERTIKLAEDELEKSGSLYCLGQIVHNEGEEERLKKSGLIIIDHKKLRELKNTKVLIRAHGEPPETYRNAKENNIELIEGTCPVVLKLQENIRKTFENNLNNDGQILIYGKKDHPEVIGLSGQTEYKAIVVENENDLGKIEFSRPVFLFAQTTKSREVFEKISHKIESGIKKPVIFESNNTICRHVIKRDETLKLFASQNDVVIFVGGKHSSNGKYLFGVCKSVNKNSYCISEKNEIDFKWFYECGSVGISGATSTPERQLKKIEEFISGNQ